MSFLFSANSSWPDVGVFSASFTGRQSEGRPLVERLVTLCWECLLEFLLSGPRNRVERYAKSRVDVCNPFSTEEANEALSGYSYTGSPQSTKSCTMNASFEILPVVLLVVAEILAISKLTAQAAGAQEGPAGAVDERERGGRVPAVRAGAAVQEREGHQTFEAEPRGASVNGGGVRGQSGASKERRASFSLEEAEPHANLKQKARERDEARAVGEGRGSSPSPSAPASSHLSSRRKGGWKKERERDRHAQKEAQAENRIADCPQSQRACKSQETPSSSSLLSLSPCSSSSSSSSAIGEAHNSVWSARLIPRRQSPTLPLPLPLPLSNPPTNISCGGEEEEEVEEKGQAETADAMQADERPPPSGPKPPEVQEADEPFSPGPPSSSATSPSSADRKVFEREGGGGLRLARAASICVAVGRSFVSSSSSGATKHHRTDCRQRGCGRAYVGFKKEGVSWRGTTTQPQHHVPTSHIQAAREMVQKKRSIRIPRVLDGWGDTDGGNEDGGVWAANPFRQPEMTLSRLWLDFYESNVPKDLPQAGLMLFLWRLAFEIAFFLWGDWLCVVMGIFVIPHGLCWLAGWCRGWRDLLYEVWEQSSDSLISSCTLWGIWLSRTWAVCSCLLMAVA
uniref:Uncharacterized protein n=1 Tax=Chromera velia CCMP2878 TaxID=1169474 RepID=A0A0G4FZH6_9ALVE|eukprot:Cvel_19540.t1-p1 / transcript=Cvel_19540.t1 / gene=Cvel_19540 / organism=Chromera_velia_CCMP2878 / gene_product=hypothetical protein / transcript_product=hypothetical protein / location=Cvel_scaffold1692:16945-19213(-) / protein_length=623 / sequence_SO=supercontig / SO=protein_coding / is_pseudo=false